MNRKDAHKILNGRLSLSRAQTERTFFKSCSILVDFFDANVTEEFLEGIFSIKHFRTLNVFYSRRTTRDPLKRFHPST